MKNEINVLIATGLFPPQEGGPATYSALIARELPHCGIRTQVVSFGEYVHMPAFFRHVAFFLRLIKEARGIDLIYAQDPVSVGFPVMIASSITGIPYVLKVVGDYAWEQGVQRAGVAATLDDFVVNIEARKSFLVRVLWCVQGAVARRAKRVIVPSNYLKGIVSAWKVPADTIDVVLNSFDMPPSAGSRAEIKAEAGIAGHAIVSVARLVPWKGIDTVIRLMPDVLSADPDAVLFVVGDGPDRARLERVADETGVHSAVRFTGRVSHDEVARYLAMADIFVLNTGYEGLSHVLLEAMAAEAAVVTTPAGGNTEVVNDGTNGLLVPKDDKQRILDALLLLMADAGKRTAIAKAGKVSLSRFDRNIMLQKLSDILKTCASS